MDEWWGDWVSDGSVTRFPVRYERCNFLGWLEPIVLCALSRTGLYVFIQCRGFGKVSTVGKGRRTCRKLATKLRETKASKVYTYAGSASD